MSFCTSINCDIDSSAIIHEVDKKSIITVCYGCISGIVSVELLALAHNQLIMHGFNVGVLEMAGPDVSLNAGIPVEADGMAITRGYLSCNN